MDAPTSTPTAPACRSCGGRTIRWGRDRAGHVRHCCKACGATFAVIPPRPLGRMRISPERATLILSLLTEGCSIRSAERVSNTHRDTITRLLLLAGKKAAALLDVLVSGVEVKDVQADEIWAFVEMKEKTKTRKGITDLQVGDAYTFVAVERSSKVVLAHHLGRRSGADASRLMAKLEGATKGCRFQLSTDGFDQYEGAVEEHFGADVDYGQIIKTFGSDLSDERRYSPPSIIGAEKRAISGDPDEARVCTSHVERQNLHMRMQLRRLTRLTNGFSKKWENLRAALALHFWAYNFTWMHSTIRCTPAMAAGVARKPLRVGDLLAA
jgi:IS1 family transposase/transposase-like protein